MDIKNNFSDFLNVYPINIDLTYAGDMIPIVTGIVGQGLSLIHI